MRHEEAVWIKDRLSALPADRISPVLELGSATAHFRVVFKPHIDQEIHAPLRARGIAIVHADAKSGDGVDISGDALDPEIRSRLRGVGAKCLLCCNMFEHVTDRAALAAVCDEALAPGGVLVVTVPRSYPYHLDPIDTYFRPSVEQIVALFPGYTVLASDALKAGSYWSDILGADNLGIELVRTLGKLLLPLGGLEMWKSRLHRFLWLARPYVIAAVVMSKPEPSSTH